MDKKVVPSELLYPIQGTSSNCWNREGNDANPPKILSDQLTLSQPSLGPAFLEYVKIPLSLENVRHSEPTSITRSPTTSPHIEHIISPVIRKRMNYQRIF